MSFRIAIVALGLVMSALTGPIDSAQATAQGRAYAARHHTDAHAVHRIHNATRHHARAHVAHRARHGGYSLTLRDIWGPAKMPPAPTDFGTHFDFPPASLNNGPTEAPYAGW